MTWTWLGIAAAVFILILGFLGFHRGFIREVVATAFVLLSLVLVYMVNPYVNRFLRENTSLERRIQEKCDYFVADKAKDITNMGSEGQSALLRNLELPQLLTQQLKESNTGKTYQELKVSDFTGYVSSYLTNLLVNGISFIITYVLITILIRVALSMMELLSRLPIIHGVNRMAGAVVGAGKAVIFIWIAMLVLTILAGSEFGKKGLEMVSNDSILLFLYEQNVLMKVFLNIFS